VLETRAEEAAAVGAAELRRGLVTWATVDSPWLSLVERGAFKERLASLGALGPEVVLSSHLPPAAHMTDTLFNLLYAACAAPPFVGPDQEAVRRTLAR
jgi:hypothetical protein